jgi:cell division protein FtsN
MKIAVYIGDLLYDYECVVIPGLGGFISRDYPASIHPVKHYFSPPRREIVFNPWLRANDGLLLNHIALNEKLPYHEAKSRLDRFVLKCLSALGDGKRINFRNVGVIYMDKDQQLVFEPDTQSNYLPDAFGLSGFVSPPIKRDEGVLAREPIFARPARKPAQAPSPEPAPMPKISPKRPMIASTRPSNLRRQLIIIGTTAAALLAGAAYMNKNLVTSYYHQYLGEASVLPLFYASPSEYLLMQMDKLPKDMILMSKTPPSVEHKNIKAKKAVDDLQPAEPYRPQSDASQQSASEPEANQSSTDVTTNMGNFGASQSMLASNTSGIDAIEAAPEHEKSAQIESTYPLAPKAEALTSAMEPQPGFYIVAGAFRDKTNADKLVKKLQQNRFEAAITGRTNSGLWRVTYERLDNRQAALNRLDEIKRTIDSQAWLLVI